MSPFSEKRHNVETSGLKIYHNIDGQLSRIATLPLVRAQPKGLYDKLFVFGCTFIHWNALGCLSGCPPNMGRIEQNLVVLRCVFWMFATVLYSIKRGHPERGRYHSGDSSSYWFSLLKYIGPLLLDSNDPTDKIPRCSLLSTL